MIYSYSAVRRSAATRSRLIATTASRRPSSTSSQRQEIPRARRNRASPPCETWPRAETGGIMTDLTLTPEIREMRQRVRGFMDENIYPNEEVLSDHNGQSESLMKDLQASTKSMGMWAPHLPAEAVGMGIGFMPYVYVNEILGRSPYAPRAFGAQAPDSGTAEILWQFGT